MIFTGSRIYYAIGTDNAGNRALAWVGRWNAALGTPVRSLVLQAVVTLALVVGVGACDNGFERLVVFTAPLFWSFFLLTGVALFVLRRREPNTARPYRVPLYPITPILFCLSSRFLLQSSVRYAWAKRQMEALWTIAVMVVGIVFACGAGETIGRGAEVRAAIASARSPTEDPEELGSSPSCNSSLTIRMRSAIDACRSGDRSSLAQHRGLEHCCIKHAWPSRAVRMSMSGQRQAFSASAMSPAPTLRMTKAGAAATSPRSKSGSEWLRVPRCDFNTSASRTPPASPRTVGAPTRNRPVNFVRSQVLSSWLMIT